MICDCRITYHNHRCTNEDLRFRALECRTIPDGERPRRLALDSSCYLALGTYVWHTCFVGVSETTPGFVQGFILRNNTSGSLAAIAGIHLSGKSCCQREKIPEISSKISQLRDTPPHLSLGVSFSFHETGNTGSKTSQEENKE